MTEIDFLPVEYWKRRASQRDQWYLLGIGAASLALLLASVVHESSDAGQLRAQLKSVETEYEDASAHVEEVERVKLARAPLAFDARFHSLLRARPSLSRAMAALATSCPPRLSLTAVRLKTATVARAESKAPGTGGRGTAGTSTMSPAEQLNEQLGRFATQRELSRVLIELTGVAESDLELSDFMEQLENAGCFTDVTLGNSADSLSPGVSELREFKILCRLVEVF
jgi:Tfp pilus assembly protein PilN